MPGKSPFRQRPERVARRNYYYCYRREEQRQFHAEHTLQKLEETALPILRQLRERRFTLNPQDRLTFAGYIALSHTRVPTFERSVDRIASLLVAKQLEFVADDKRALGEAVAEMREQTGEEIDPEEFRKKLTGGAVVAKADEPRVVATANVRNDAVFTESHLFHELDVPAGTRR